MSTVFLGFVSFFSSLGVLSVFSGVAAPVIALLFLAAIASTLLLFILRETDHL